MSVPAESRTLPPESDEEPDFEQWPRSPSERMRADGLGEGGGQGA